MARQPSDLPGFILHGERYRLGCVGFLSEDAAFLHAEAARRDCSIADVVREAVRAFRADRHHRSS